MQLTVILSILITLLLAHFAPAERVSNPVLFLSLIIALMTMVVLLAHLMAFKTAKRLHREREHRTEILNRFCRWQLWHIGFWVISNVVVYGLLNWVQLVRFNWQLVDAVLLDELLILLPLLLPLILSWAAFYQVEHALYTTCHSAFTAAAIPSRPQYVALHARLYLGTMLLPLLLIIVIQDLISLWQPNLLESSGAWIVVLSVSLLVVVFFPWLIKTLWQCKPLAESALRDQLFQLVQQSGCKIKDCVVWETQSYICNAMAAGVIGPFRYIFLSDNLLKRLSEEETIAIFAHEVSHIRRRHLALRVAVLLLPVLILLAVLQVFQLSSGITTLDLSQVIAAHWSISLAVIVGIILFGGYLFAPFCRLLEFDADLHAEQLLQENHQTGDHLSEALTKLTAANGIQPEHQSWLHPSLQQRLDFLKETQENQATSKLFTEKLAVCTTFITLLTILLSVINFSLWLFL